MGLITIFVKGDCPYCEKVTQIVETLLKEVEDHVCGMEEKHHVVFPQKPSLDLQFIQATGANASLCIRLTGKMTVPHVFFNTEYVGDASMLCCIDEHDRKVCCPGNSSFASEVHGHLFEKILQLALSPDPIPAFPPPCDAVMYKISDEFACSCQPTEKQIAELGKLGFKSVVNLTNASERAFLPSEEEIIRSSQVSYFHVPCNSKQVNEGTVLDAIRVASSAPRPVLIHDPVGNLSTLVAFLSAIKSFDLLQNQQIETKLDSDTVISWADELNCNLTEYKDLITRVIR